MKNWLSASALMLVFSVIVGFVLTREDEGKSRKPENLHVDSLRNDSAALNQENALITAGARQPVPDEKPPASAALSSANVSGRKAEVLGADFEKLASDAVSDSSALLQLDALIALCQQVQRERASNEPRSRVDGSTWLVVSEVCTPSSLQTWRLGHASVDAQVAEEIMPQAWQHAAKTVEEFAERDRRLRDAMAASASAAAAFNAAIIFFDFERFSQWAGRDRPIGVFDERSYRRSRIGVDVSWIFACRVGLDCGPYSPFTLQECWLTPSCQPGGAARQVVQMRRSPLELRLVDSMVERLLAERAGIRR